MRKAAEVDGELKRERYRGPLQGIPFGAKDLLRSRDRSPLGARSHMRRKCSTTTRR